MLSILSKILCWIKQFGAMVLDALIGGFNAVIKAIAKLLQALVNASPIDMPDVPALPEGMSTALAWVAWIFPVNTLIAVIAFCLSVWIFWQGLALVLRWAKAIDA